MSKKIPSKNSSGNVFADLALPNPEDRLAKASLAFRIAQVIRDRHLTQSRAAQLLEIDQPKISRLLRGQLSGFSTDCLMRFLILLGHDIEIVVKRTPRATHHGRLRVRATA